MVHLLRGVTDLVKIFQCLLEFVIVNYRIHHISDTLKALINYIVDLIYVVTTLLCDCCPPKAFGAINIWRSICYLHQFHLSSLQYLQQS